MTKESKLYKTAADFRQALENKVRVTWREQPGTSYQDHTRRVAFERCLARFDSTKTTLKGGYALELRLSEARVTRDMDLTIIEKNLLIADKEKQAQAIREYIQAQLDLDLDDYFTFEVKPGAKHLRNAEGGGTRLTIISKIDDRVFREFHIDIEIRANEILPPEHRQGRNLLAFAGVSNPTVSITPNEVMFAEKLHAYTAEWNDRENTRVKDIVDINCLLDQNMDQNKVDIAIQKLFKADYLPEKLPYPPDSWDEQYSKLALQVNLNLDLDEAYKRLNSYYEQLYSRNQRRT
jgi:hypothetical protein